MERGNSELIHGELERILASEGFAHNERLSGFLRYVVEEELSGRGDQLKESLVGVAVFGRRPDYDVRQDSVVRTEAARLRARLAEYYVNGGAPDPVVIELPKGGYKPVFREVESPAEAPVRTEPPRRATRHWLVAALGFAALTVLVTGWWLLWTGNAPISIAVLPLVNLSQDSSSDYFADGLTGEIIRNLSIIDGLAVRSQTSSFVFKGKAQNIRDAGKQLDVEYILEGSVLRSGEQLRINTQLVRVHDDFPLWSGRYDRELTDVFSIQDEISRGIVNGLRLKLGRGRRRYETSTEAYDLYLRARAFETQSTGGRNKSVPFYEQALAKDPSFAPAYAGLGAAYAYRTGEDRLADWAVLSRAEETSRMRVAVQKALQLDPLLAEAHAALGMVQARDAQWEQAEKSFRRALELEPGRATTRLDFARYLLLPLGRIEEAVAQDRLAEKSDPLSADVQQRLAYVLFSAGRFDEASAHCEKPCVRALILKGRAAEAIPILEARYNGRLSVPGSGELLGYAYARVGRREDAERIAAIQLRPIEQATIFVALGDNDRAIEALTRAIPLGPVRIGLELSRPELAPLRGDARLRALRKGVGLPE
jgi:serine/threonine-protein kinase